MTALINLAIGQIQDLQDAIRAATEPQSPFRDSEKVFLHSFMGSCLRWDDLSTRERIMLRFCWENYYRTSCPFPLHPRG